MAKQPIDQKRLAFAIEVTDRACLRLDIRGRAWTKAKLVQELYELFAIHSYGGKLVTKDRAPGASSPTKRIVPIAEKRLAFAIEVTDRACLRLDVQGLPRTKAKLVQELYELFAIHS